jgi:hypothetical protein
VSLAQHPVVILGAPGKASSALEVALTRLGVLFGSQGQVDALTEYNRKCLAFFQIPPFGFGSAPKNWRSYPQGKFLLNELRSMISDTFFGHPIWGLSQPFATLLAPLYQEIFWQLDLTPRFIICAENPSAIEGSSSSNEVGGWIRYSLGALGAAKDAHPILAGELRFAYDPKQLLAEIVASQPGWSPSDLEWASAIASIESCRFEQKIVDGALGLPTIVGDIWNLFSSNFFDADKTESLIREYELWRQILHSPNLPGTRMGLAWRRGSNVESAVKPFLPSGDWQSVSVEITAPPLTELHGLLYSMPCRVWIRKSSFAGQGFETQAKLRAGPGSHLSEIEGVLRLDGAYEARQVILVTPRELGPYVWNLEFLLESGEGISNEAAMRLTERIHRCEAGRLQLERQIRKNRVEGKR